MTSRSGTDPLSGTRSGRSPLFGTATFSSLTTSETPMSPSRYSYSSASLRSGEFSFIHLLVFGHCTAVEWYASEHTRIGTLDEEPQSH